MVQASTFKWDQNNDHADISHSRRLARLYGSGGGTQQRRGRRGRLLEGKSFSFTDPKPTAERSPVAGRRAFLATSAGCSDVTSIKDGGVDGEQRRLTKQRFVFRGGGEPGGRSAVIIITHALEVLWRV